MKIKLKSILGLLMLIVLFFTQTASAFYDANLGRWINRDPLGDEGFFALYQGHDSGPRHIDLVNFAEPAETRVGPNLFTFVFNDSLNLIDPHGLSSIHAQVISAVGSGDVAALESLLATGQLNAAQQAMVQAAINKYRSTAVQWIAKNCKGSIGREFPSQLYNKTLEQIRNGTDAISKKAWKLLNKGEYKK